MTKLEKRQSTIKCPHCTEVFIVRKNKPERNFNEVMFHMFIFHNDIYNKAVGIEI